MQELEDAEEISLFLAGPLAGSVFPSDTDRALAIALDQVTGQAWGYLWSLPVLTQSEGGRMAG